MKLLTLAELKQVPKGSFVIRALWNSNDNLFRPSGSIVVWSDPGNISNFFGYGVSLTPDGFLESYEKDEWSDIPSRFYFRNDHGPVNGEERFYLLEPQNLKFIIQLAMFALGDK